MCWCTPSLRTPCCCKINCHPKSSTISNNTKADDRFWPDQEMLVRVNIATKYRLLLEQTLDMLEYSHTTSEVYYDHKKVGAFIEEMYKVLEER